MAGKVNIPTGLGGVLDNVDAFDDLANDIAAPPSNRPLRNAIGRSGQLYCDAVGSKPGQFLAPFLPGALVSPLLCKPYWDSRGYSPPSETPPFTGGQCAVSYRCSVVRGAPNGSTSNPAALANILGPVTSQTVTFIGNFQYRMTVFGQNNSPGGANIHTQNILANEGAPRFGPLVRNDGQADNCGNLPGDLFPGINPPPTPTFPPGQEPGADPDGRPFFRVPDLPNPLVGGDPIPLPDVPSPGPDVPGGGDEPPPPTEPPSAGPESPGGSGGDEDFPEPEPGTRWVGCCIRLTTIPQGTGTIPGTAPETILTQVVGNARLLFDSVNGQEYDTPVQIRSAGLCLWEPVKGLSPKGVRVNLKPGFAYAYTPYSVEDTE